MRDWIQTEWEWMKRIPRRVFHRRKLNFIAIHYIYIVGWTIAGSILLYPAGGMAYIDALFFAAGSSTQSGLNTLNVNQIFLQQQIMLSLIPIFTNPIVIHGTVVFVRLYWFEKRFQHVVQEAMSWRRSRTRSVDRDPEELKTGSDSEHGIRASDIVLMGDGRSLGSEAKPALEKGDKPNDTPDGSSSPSKSDHSGEHANGHTKEYANGREDQDPASPGAHRREIAFADQVMQSPALMSPSSRLPEPRSPDHNIAFLERQRNPDDKGALRIPGPRDFDRGKVPERIDSDDPVNMLSKEESQGEATGRNFDRHERPRSEDGFNRNITIDDSARPSNANSARRGRSYQSRVTFRRIGTSGSNAIEETDDALDPPRTRPRARSNTVGSFLRTTSTQRDPGPVPYLSYQPTVGRNSAFIDLTEAQREELGGIEYRSLKTLAVIIIGYYVFWYLLGIICYVPWIILTDEWGSIVDADGVSRVWWGIFSSGTLFNDVGFTLTPDSFMSFQLAVLPLLLGATQIVVGNTGFPCMLRLWIWVIQKVVPRNSSVWEELRFLLDHPRRCFTLLFPSSATWVLFAILILLNGIDLIFFIILDLNDPTVDVLPPGFRVLDGLFQATSTRTAGTAVVNIANLHPGIQVSYLIMMYISVFPIAISMRRTNVYEERSLGVYTSTEEDEEDGKEPSYVGAHLRKQLSFDLWFIFLGLFIVAIAEGDRIADASQPAFNLFSCLFEIVSAYGTVGLSLGYPNIDESFSAEFSVVSKLVIIAMMIRGRHRGLPYELDRAILLPSENLHKDEDQDAAYRTRRASMASYRASVSEAAVASGVDSSANGELAPIASHTSRRRSGTHSHFHQRPHARDGVAKMAEGLAHADSAAKMELAAAQRSGSG